MKKFADIQTVEELWERVETRNGKPFLSCGNRYGEVKRFLHDTPSPYPYDAEGQIEVNVEYCFHGSSVVKRYIYDLDNSLRLNLSRQLENNKADRAKSKA